MKTSERHHLKENDFAMTVASVSETVAVHRRNLLIGVGVLLVVAILAGGYWFWQRQQNEKASALLAAARVVASAQVAALPTLNSPAVGAGTYATEKARDEAAVKKFQEAAAAFPKTPAGIVARYQAASLLAELGKVSEAEQAYNEVARLDGNGLHGRMARLGVAALQLRAGKFDPAIQTLQELSQRTDTDLPIDGVLMQLGDAYRRAGRTPEAIRAYTRVVDEFAESAYAADAKTEIDQLKAQPAK
jgi:predicted negative regulator of RcsB-dependent stress response